MKSRRRTTTRVLLVEHDTEERERMTIALGNRGYRVESVPTETEALETMADLAPDAVVLGATAASTTILELVEAIRRVEPALPLIVLASHDDIPAAIVAMRAGASDYLVRPVQIGELVLAIETALEQRDLTAEADLLRRAVAAGAPEAMSGLLGSSAVMQPIYRTAHQVASTRATVLLTGESGTGKSELAKAIHAASPRASGPFVAVHCAALSESIIDSELFGHERGSFTGAEQLRKGRFELAHGGTLFLDEIGEVAPMTQVKLLRVLQERTFERVGGNTPITVDTRLLAATNRDLEADVAAGRFREDLFYRLNVVRIEVPPLRTRGEDILTLATHFLRRFAEENGKSIQGMSDAVRATLLAARWPGNVRELENAIEHAVIVCKGEMLEDGDLPIIATPESFRPVRIPGATMRDLERYAILKTLEAVGWSTSRAADILKIGTRTIQYRIHEYDLGRFRPHPSVVRTRPPLVERPAFVAGDGDR